MRWRSATATGLSLAFLLSALPTASAESTGADENLARNRPYTVSAPVVDSRNVAYEATFPDNGTKLTDGVIGPAGWQANGPWVGYIRQDYRDVVIDLGAEQTIHKLSAHFLQDKGAGIRFPEKVTSSVSDNSVAWSHVGEVPTNTPLSVSGARVQEFQVDGLNLTGRYVKISFPTNVWVFLSEVQAWGQQGHQPGAQKPQPTPPSVQTPKMHPLAGSSQAGGKKHQNLMYAGYYRPFDTTTIGKWTTEELLPYVAYLDENHTPRDFMFDSFLLMPFGAYTPSGKGNYGTGNTLKSDWQFFVDYNFQQELNLGALDRAIAQAKAALGGNDDYKVKLSVAMPFPGLNSDWGDGLDFNPANVGEEQALANRTAAVKWYVDYVKAKFTEAAYTNLELNGFYWYAESVNYALTPNEEALIRQAGQIVHNAGHVFEWIPFNMTEGFRKWEAFGFDTALMQPNYFFGGWDDRLEVNAQLAKQYGMGVEMEMDYSVLSNNAAGETARAKYYRYLDAAHAYHYQNSFMAWYQAYNILWSAERSAVPVVRALYDDTYKFIKGTYQPTYRPGPGDTGSPILNPTGISDGSPDRDPDPQN